MSETPFVSAVLPVWNGAEYLEESINSVQAQTMADWELLIIGEPDGTAEIKLTAMRYAANDCRIRWIENETHLGLAASLNKGIELAQGKYIARIDVDDPSYPARFKKQMCYLDEHPEVGLLGTQFNAIYSNRSEISDFPTKPENIKAGLLFRVYVSHPTVMFPRKLFLVNSWQYPNEIGEDYALWINILNTITIANLAEPLLDRRFATKTNITFLKGAKVVDFNQRIRQMATQKYFHIDTNKFALNRFLYFLDLPCEHVPIAELANWMADSTFLLLEMERKNEQYGVFDRAALARTLRKRWNWLLDGCLISKIYSIAPNFPLLTEKSDNSFAVDLTTALRDNGLLTLSSSHNSLFDSIVSITRNIAAIFINHMTELFESVPVVAIFGIGSCFDNFFADYANTNSLFALTYFCDNDPTKHGQSRHGKPILAPSELLYLEFDYILIATRDYYDDVHSQLIGMNIPADKLLPLDIFRYKARP
jgi:glycosyltransferase involved in cell wall biosynthesis